MLYSILPLFISCMVTEFCVTSSLALENWGKKFYQTLGNKPLLAMKGLFNKKGNDRYLWSVLETLTPCAARTIIFQRKSLKYLIVCITRCTLFFQCVCFLLLICLPCISCGTYCNEDKCCDVTHRTADFRVDWLVYVTITSRTFLATKNILFI